MKLLPLIAAAGLAFVMPGAASAAVAPAKAPLVSGSVAAPAQTRVRVSVSQRDYQRRHHWGRHDNRRAYWRRSCRTYWRHGHRVRTCNRVRYWR